MSQLKKFQGKLLIVIICLLWVGCASQGNLGKNEPVKLGNSVSWVMGADTFRECVFQAYLNAGDRLDKLAKGKEPGTWCVIFDTDETLLNNSLYQAEQQSAGLSYNENTWGKWCDRMEATALPGAVDFCRRVQNLGGKVIVISNRRGDLMDATTGNLNKVGIPFDACLLKGGSYRSDSSKIARRAAIRNGGVDWDKNAAITNPLGEEFPPLEILMLCGDQAHDLYDPAKLTYQDVKDRFSRELVVIPNPMYGFPPVYYDRNGDRVLTGKEAAGSPAK